jgi:DNA polymerase I
MSKRPIFYLLDGHAIAYRQFFGLPLDRFSTSDGEPTNATYGFTRILMDIIQKEKPDYLAVSFDDGLSGRDKIYPEYKGTRDKMPDELDQQMKRIEQLVRAFNIPVLKMQGYEADDLIGTVTRQAEKQGVHIYIVTGDYDLLQLLTDHVTVQLPPRRGETEVRDYNIKRFIEEYEIRPDQLVDQKALMGDTSDNIPGIAGIGEKTSIKLLKKYDTLDNIYKNAEDASDIRGITGKMQEKLIAGRDLAYISQDLAQIRCDLPVDLDLAACVSHDFAGEPLLELFDELEFRTYKRRLLELLQAKAEQEEEHDDEDFSAPLQAENEIETVIVTDEAALRDLVAVLKDADAITWDVETTSINQMEAELVGIALAVDGKRGYYVPVAHVEGDQLPMQTVLDALRPALTDPDIPKYAHNAAYDLVVTERHGVEVTPVTFDSMIAAWLCDPISDNLGLKNFALNVLKPWIQMKPITDLIGTGKKQKRISQVSIKKVAPYAAADAAVTYRAVTFLWEKIKAEGLLDLFYELEMPLVPVIVTMEQHGIMLDTPYLRQMSQHLDDQLAALEQKIHELGGAGEFNVNSTKQLSAVLFDKDNLNLPKEGLKKTRYGYSTDAATLQKVLDDTGAEIVREVLEYRELAKLKGTYVDALPELVNAETGRLHTSYNQTGTSTGRLSSSNPNLQSIPIRTEIGREVRRAFIAPPGATLLAVDYSQVELRILAHISGDETLLRAFEEDQDIHAATAAAVYGVPLDEVTYDQRSFAKRVNFGLIYGMGAYRLARDSELTLGESQRFIETYFERLPKVQDYIEETKRSAASNGYVETLLGRKRYFKALQEDQVNRRKIEAEQRAAINMPVQGTAADIMKRAMINLYHALQQRGLNAKMILQVHDELVLEVPDAELDTTRALVVKVMEDAYTLRVPLRANAQFGQNWRDMDDYK